MSRPNVMVYRSVSMRLNAPRSKRLASDQPYWMIQPADLWQVGVTLADLRGDDGRLDPARLRDTLREVLEARPTWRRPVDMGLGAHGMPAGDERKPGLSALLGRR
jgi:hypothetical protein